MSGATIPERLGAGLFRLRSWTPLPLLTLGLILARPTVGSVLAGLALTITGEAIRMASVAHIGSRSRTRSGDVGMLVTTGPYARCRNPLYLGNVLLAAGLALGVGVPALAAVTVGVVALQYVFIVAWEESRLARVHGQAYGTYVTAVPRFLPRPGRRGAPPAAPETTSQNRRWSAVLRSERGTLLVHLAAWTAVIAVGAVRGTL